MRVMSSCRAFPPQMNAVAPAGALGEGCTQVLMKLAVAADALELRASVTAHDGLLQMMQHANPLVMLLLLLMTPPMIILHAFDELPSLRSVCFRSAPLYVWLGQFAVQRETWWKHRFYSRRCCCFAGHVAQQRTRFILGDLRRPK